MVFGAKGLDFRAAAKDEIEECFYASVRLGGLIIVKQPGEFRGIAAIGEGAIGWRNAHEIQFAAGRLHMQIRKDRDALCLPIASDAAFPIDRLEIIEEIDIRVGGEIRFDGKVAARPQKKVRVFFECGKPLVVGVEIRRARPERGTGRVAPGAHGRGVSERLHGWIEHGEMQRIIRGKTQGACENHG